MFSQDLVSPILIKNWYFTVKEFLKIIFLKYLQMIWQILEFAASTGIQMFNTLQYENTLFSLFPPI